jgi:hypothetical protein
MLRRFRFGRFALAVSTLTAPVFAEIPFVGPAFIGQPLTYIPATLVNPGFPAPALTTEVINASGDVLPASYVVQQGDYLRVQQRVSTAAGDATVLSGGVWAQPAVNGYTDLTPVARSTGVALTAATQPGSRLYYCDPVDGVVPTAGEIYFWDGARIIDSTGSATGAGGVAYGNDWRNPSGPVKAWKHLTACMQTRNGAEPGIRTGDNGAGGGYFDPNVVRQGYPDRWLLKRGRTFDLDGDVADYKTYVPSFTSTYLMVGLAGGSSASNLQAVCDYGPSNLPQPRIIRLAADAVSTDLTKRRFTDKIGAHVRFQGLHFDGRGRASTFRGGVEFGSLVKLTADKINQGMEDCRLSAVGVGNLTTAADLTGGRNQFYLYRCIVTDAYTKAPASPFIDGMHSESDPPGKMALFDCRVGRNGFRGVDPARIERGIEVPPAHDPQATYALDDIVLSGGEWYGAAVAPPVGTAITNTSYWVQLSTDGGRRALGTKFDRNFYFSGAGSDLFDSVVLRGGSGEQWRGGGFIQRNFIQAGYLLIADVYDKTVNARQTTVTTDNVLQNVNQSGNHTGNNLIQNPGVRYSLYQNNIWTGAAEEATGTAVGVASLATIADPGNTLNQTQYNVIRYNLFSCATGQTISLADGVATKNLARPYPAVPALLNNRITDNDFITTSSLAPSYTPLNFAPATTDTVTTGNVAWANRAAYATAKGGVDPTRTLKTYLQSLGVTVTSFDGVQEMIDAWATHDRFNWPAAYSAKAICNYIRAGHGWAVLS